MIKSLLIANRGEIAVRIARTARRLGVRVIAVYSDADANAAHVAAADEAYHIGPAPAVESYLKGDVILEVAKRADADAIHPGYGFLSENADFAEACAKAGVIFVGPSADAIRAMGEKDRAKALMADADVPVVPGYHGDDQSPDLLKAEAEKAGYPVLIKAALGGGGKGMRLVEKADDFDKALAAAQREAKAAFGDDRCLIEKFVTSPRHIEVQVFGWPDGHVDALFERDCSVQRRHQKIIEEAPAPGMTDGMRSAMCDAAIKAAKAVDYVGAGTVEFIVDGSGPLRPDGFWFMEMNTRLQVEHPVTEAITGVDLVDWQLRAAAGEGRPDIDLTISGHAIEARLYAENPDKKFLPSTGLIEVMNLKRGRGLRIDAGVRAGDEVSVYYDPMIAKVIAKGESRDDARKALARSLRASTLLGPKTNLNFLAEVLDHPAFSGGDFTTAFVDDHLADLTSGFDEALVRKAMSAAVLALLLRDERSTPADLWDRTDGFRVGGVAPIRLPMAGPLGEVDIAAFQTGPSHWQLEAGGLTQIVEGRLHKGQVRGVVGDQKIDLPVHFTADGVTIVMDGKPYEMTRLDPYSGEPGDEAGAGGDAILAPMPGKIVSLAVAVGDKVRAGDNLGVLEAMKMEHALIAPRDGVVDSLGGSAGDQLDEGAVVIAFQPQAS